MSDAVPAESAAAKAMKEIIEKRKSAKPSADLPCHGCGGQVALDDWARGKRRRCVRSGRWEDSCFLGPGAAPVSEVKAREEKPVAVKAGTTRLPSRTEVAEHLAERVIPALREGANRPAKPPAPRLVPLRPPAPPIPPMPAFTPLRQPAPAAPPSVLDDIPLAPAPAAGSASPRVREILLEAIVALEAEKGKISEAIEHLAQLAK